MARPYNPLLSPMGSRASIIARARRRAVADTAAKMALLPSDATLRGANASLLSSISGQLADFSKLAGNIGGSYGAAVAPAAASDASTAAQVGATGAQPVVDTRGGLLGAMAGSTFGALQGRQSAAQLGLAGILTANAGKRAAVGAGQNALFEQYLQAGYDDALRQAAARSNSQISLAGVGIDQQNANSRAVSADASASRADTARRKLEADKAGTPDKELRKALDKAFAALQKALTGKGTTTRTIAGDYNYSIPGVVSDVSGVRSKPLTFTVRAKTGAEARRLATTRLAQLKQSGQLAGYDYNEASGADVYYTAMNPVTQDVSNAGASRTAALHIATTMLENAGYDHATALALARGWLPSKPKSRKKRDPNAGGK